jgi:hypothetical protein
MKTRTILIGSLILIFSFCKQPMESREYKDFEYYNGFTLAKNEGFEYTKECIFYTQKSKFIAQDCQKYKQGKLVASYSCHSEGRLDNSITEQKNTLLLKNGIIHFNKKQFEVTEINGDSIVGKNNNDEVLIVIK